MTVLEQFRALCDFRVPEDSGCGVITAADTGFFPGIQFLCAACQGRVPLLVFDAGLTAEQRDWCAARVEVRDFPDPLVPRTEEMWPAWNKPLLFRHSPFRTTLWLDADCLVVGDLNPLFARAAEGPFGVPSQVSLYPRPNKEILYQKHPVPQRIPNDRIVNGGVLGFGSDERSARLLTAWEGMVCEAGRDAEVREAIGFHDEGALHWAVEATGSTEVCTPLVVWNRSTFAVGRGGPEAFLSRLKVKPGDVILHLVVRPKPWTTWGDLEAEAE
jgi:hypothetical protein